MAKIDDAAARPGDAKPARRRRRPLPRGGRRVRPRAPPVRLQAGRSAGDRADRGVRPDRSARPPTSCRRKCTRSRTAAAIRSRLRPEFTAGICRAYLSEGWQQYRAAEGRDPRPGLPLRAAAEGPLPPVPPARRRDHRRRRSRGGRRDSALRRPAAAGARHRRRDAASSTRSAMRKRATRGARRWSSISKRTAASLSRGQPGAARAQSAADPRQQGPAGPADRRRRADDRRLPDERSRGFLRAGHGRPRRGRRADGRATRAWSAASIITATPRSSSSPTASARRAR